MSEGLLAKVMHVLEKAYQVLVLQSDLVRLKIVGTNEVLALKQLLHEFSYISTVEPPVAGL